MADDADVAFAVLGTILHTPEFNRLEVVRDALVCVDSKGFISGVFVPPERASPPAPRPSDARAPDAVDEGASSAGAGGGAGAGAEAAATPTSHPTYPPGLLDRLEAAGKLDRLAAHHFLLPGLVDCHFHAPQWPLVGRGMNLTLEEWLKRHAFPAERACGDTHYARELYNSLVPALLARGTTTALYFATIHLEGTKALADACLRHGQRAFVGKVNMDNPAECPASYIEETQQSLDDTETFIKYVRSQARKAATLMAGGAAGVAGDDEADAASDIPSLVEPVITPRFLPSCSDTLLTGLGALAAKYDCHIQSHCSESHWVVDYGKERFGDTDAAVFERFGLLRKNTVMAHAPFLTDDDLARFHRTGAAVAHCPLSNFYLSNAAFPLHRARDAGVTVGLGTDVGGSPCSSMFQSLRDAVLTSKALHQGVSPLHPLPDDYLHLDAAITHIEAFYTATMGGAESLGISHLVGTISKGKAFDAMVVRVGGQDPASDIRVWRTPRPSGSKKLAARSTSKRAFTLPEDTDEDVFCKVCYGASERSVERVWVQGRCVKEDA